MASNFRVTRHKNKDCLHLQLAGDFDGSSAHELINILKSKDCGQRRVFVHTDGLRNVLPFGRNVFKNSCFYLPRQRLGSLRFTGKNALEISPVQALALG